MYPTMRTVLHQFPAPMESSAPQARATTSTTTTNEDQNLIKRSTTQSATHNKTAAIIPATKTTTTNDQAPLPHPLERVYDPSKDDRPIEELLARPRLYLPWEPPLYDGSSDEGGYLNCRTMKPLRRGALREVSSSGGGGGGSSGGGSSGGGSSGGGSSGGGSSGGGSSGGGFEEEKKRMRALAVEIGSLSLLKERLEMKTERQT